MVIHKISKGNKKTDCGLDYKEKKLEVSKKLEEVTCGRCLEIPRYSA